MWRTAGRGLDFDVIEKVCDVVARCAAEGAQVGIVVGGGRGKLKIFRVFSRAAPSPRRV